MRRMLVATIAAATLALGLALPAPKAACPIVVAGKRADRLCALPRTDVTFDGRHHVFVVGSNRQIYHIWQLRRGGSAYSNWTTLGGKGYSRVHVRPFSFGLDLSVTGYDGSIFRAYCKQYRVGGWSAWHGC